MLGVQNVDMICTIRFSSYESKRIRTIQRVMRFSKRSCSRTTTRKGWDSPYMPQTFHASSIASDLPSPSFVSSSTTTLPARSLATMPFSECSLFGLLSSDSFARSAKSKRRFFQPCPHTHRPTRLSLLGSTMSTNGFTTSFTPVSISDINITLEPTRMALWIMLRIGLPQYGICSRMGIYRHIRAGANPRRSNSFATASRSFTCASWKKSFTRSSAHINGA